MKFLKDYGLEQKHIVLKIEDLGKYLDDSHVQLLARCMGRIVRGRREDGKVLENQYLVVNLDEDYVEEMIEILKKNIKE